MITAALVKELRARTNVPMMDCKRALVETAGDLEKAIELMRKEGQAKAVKKAGRVVSEGIIVVCRDTHTHRAALLEVNCETDFVAREPQFQDFARTAAERALQLGVEGCEALQADRETIRLALVSTLGENISIRRLVVYPASDSSSLKDTFVGAYAHGDANGARIGALVQLTGGDPELARAIAMHVAAMAPEYLNEREIPKHRLEKEREVFLAQTQEEGKEEPLLSRIVDNKIKKFVTENTLLGQSFIKDPSKTIAVLLKEAGAEAERCVRFEVGEGIVKQEEDFLEAVMAQVRGT